MICACGRWTVRARFAATKQPVRLCTRCGTVYLYQRGKLIAGIWGRKAG